MRIPNYLFLLITFIISSVTSVTYSQQYTQTKFKEITKTDITQFKNIRAVDISVYGLYLSLKYDEALKIIKHYPGISIEQDVFNRTRYYLYKKNNSGNKVPLAYLKWDENKIILQEITLYEAISEFMAGNSGILLSPQVLQRNSTVVQTFLGFPYKRELVLDLPNLGIKSYAYLYHQNFMVTRTTNPDDTSFYFSLILNKK